MSHLIKISSHIFKVAICDLFSFSQKLFLQSPKILRTFALASPTCISSGGQLHIERRYLRFVFGDLKLPHIRLTSKNKCRKDATGCVFTSRSVPRVYYALSHTLRVYICYKAWCILFVVLLWLWKATNPKRTEVKAPRFFYVSLTRKTNCP